MIMLKTLTERLFGKSREETEREQRKYLNDLATRLLLYWIQSHGTPMEKKIATLNEAVEAVGIDAVFEQTNDGAGRPAAAGWRTSSEEDGRRALQFRKDIQACWPTGEFETEQACILGVLFRYAENSDGS